MFRRLRIRNKGRGPLRIARAVLISHGLLFSVLTADAEDIDELQAIMAKAPEKCRPDYRPYDYVDYRECETISDVTLGSNCADEVGRKNSIIWRWNRFIRNCHTAESSTGSLPLAPRADSPTPGTAKPTASGSPGGPDSAEVVAIIQRGRKLAETGDIAAARLLLRRAAEAHSAQATLALGGMYDPIVLEQLHIHGVMPDIAEARRWYEKAREYGSVEAPRRLQALVGQGP